jgi:hypothetical protein
MKINIFFSSTYYSGGRPEWTGATGVVRSTYSAALRSGSGVASYSKHETWRPYSGHSGPGPSATRAPVDFLMAVPLIFGSHGRVRDALWLWFYLWTYAKPSNTEWQPCFDGSSIFRRTDRIQSRCECGDRSEVEILERLGFVRTEVVKPRYRRYWLGQAGKSGSVVGCGTRQ